MPEFAEIDIDRIVPNEWNPNAMPDELFNMLAEDMADEDLGFLQPLLVAPREDGTYRIIDGEHRYESARINGIETVPCIVATGDLVTNEDKQKFLTVRMNKLRGSMDKRKFAEMVRELSGEYDLEELARELAFTDPDELATMMATARESLPTPEMRQEFDEAREEIKTVDDLSNVLNRLFTRYGDTVPFNFMILDFGGKNHVWVRIPQGEYQGVLEKTRLCMGRGITFDSAVMALLDRFLTEDFLEDNEAAMEKIDVDDSRDEGDAGSDQDG